MDQYTVKLGQAYGHRLYESIDYWELQLKYGSDCSLLLLVSTNSSMYLFWLNFISRLIFTFLKGHMALAFLCFKLITAHYQLPQKKENKI